MKDIVISIIVPIYNIEQYVKKCIDSILQQTYKNLEIILVDDGSSDACYTICDKYAEKDSRIKVIHKKNGGLVSARKAGANIASGKWVINVDGDDWIEKDYIQKYVSAIEKEESDIIWSLSYTRDYNGISYICGKKQSIDLEKKEKQIELAEKSIGRYGYRDDLSYYLCTKCIKREYYKNAQLSLDDKISYAEDFACVIRCLAQTDHVQFIDNSGYHYVQNEKSISHVKSKSDLEKLNLMREDTLNFLKNKNNYEYTSIILEKVYTSATVVKCFEDIQNKNKDYLVPFKNIKKGMKIIVYGLGNVGKEIASYLYFSKEYHLVACVDKRNIDETYKWKVINIDEIKRQDYDAILIATIKREFIDDIKKELVSQGIEKDKIIHI